MNEQTPTEAHLAWLEKRAAMPEMLLKELAKDKDGFSLRPDKAVRVLMALTGLSTDEAKKEIEAAGVRLNWFHPTSPCKNCNGTGVRVPFWAIQQQRREEERVVADVFDEARIAVEREAATQRRLQGVAERYGVPIIPMRDLEP